MAWINGLILAYIVLMNITAVCLTVYDKKAARKHKNRIPERTLMLTAVFGGSVGVYLTMLIIRHKTKHQKFMAGLPLIILAQAVLIGVLICFFHGE